MAWHKATTEKEKISLASPNHEADIVHRHLGVIIPKPQRLHNLHCIKV